MVVGWPGSCRSLILNFQLLMVCVNNLKTINRRPAVLFGESLSGCGAAVDPLEVEQLTPR